MSEARICLGCDREFTPVGSYTLLCASCYATPPFGSDRFNRSIMREIRATPISVTDAICAAAPQIKPLIERIVVASRKDDVV